MPGHLFEGNPVDEGTTQRGTDTLVHRPQRPAGSTHSSTRGLRPPEQLERQAEFPSSDKTRPESPVPTLHGPCDRSPKWRGSLRFLPPLEMRPSSIAPNPAESREAPSTPQHPSPLRGTLGSSLRSPAEVERKEGFPPQPEKDLESPSSMRLEAPVPYHDSKALTGSPRHAHGDLTFLAPHERLPELSDVLCEKLHIGAAAREDPRDAPVIVK